MNNGRRRVLIGCLICLMCFGATGCEALSNRDSVYMNYADGLGEDLQYNSELYGLNTSNTLPGADPGAIYVSKEEDEEWGGYYYIYLTGSSNEGGHSLKGDFYKENHIIQTAAQCFRSKDLHQWERCGVFDDGFVLQVVEEDWCDTRFWAPEVIRNPQDGKYYMYFSASAKEEMGVEGISSSANPFDRFYLGVAVSDTPAGPFTVLYDTDEATGKRIPTINFKVGQGLEFNWSAIDVSPFFDDNGDLYLYFNKHVGDHYNDMMGIWGMKMKSMTEPDYATVSCLAVAGKETVSNVPGDMEHIQPGGDYYDPSESGINEGPFMLKHEGKYYLTYSSNGCEHISYSVHQAVSDNPLSGFRKLSMEEGNPVLDGSVYGYMNGTAHHAIVKNGEELWIVYHQHSSTVGFSEGWERSISADRVNFVTNGEGEQVLTANGPSKILQWLPESVSGYQNLAAEAEIEVSNGAGKEYLTDQVLPFYTVTNQSVLAVDKGDLTITMKWEKPVSVSSVMVYNSDDLYSAFSKITRMRFTLAEQPEWASKDYKYAVIEDVKVSERYWDEEANRYITCAPAVAEFEPVMITELQITINEADRLVSTSKTGEKATALRLSEIVVLGGDEYEK